MRNGIQNLCASFSALAVHQHFKRAMGSVNGQRQACKNALRASLCTFTTIVSSCGFLYLRFSVLVMS